MQRTYNLFISHAWRYDEQYYRLVGFLDSAKVSGFSWKNFSVPKHDPVVDPDEPIGRAKLTKELEDQIKPVHCVLVLCGMYVAYRFWVQKEIDIAVSYAKPIVGVKPWGQERIPQEVSAVAKEIVGWNTDSIVGAIRRHAL